MSDPAGLDAQSAFSGVRPVDPGMELDLTALDAWMARAVAGCAVVAAIAAAEVRPNRVAMVSVSSFFMANLRSKTGVL